MFASFEHQGFHVALADISAEDIPFFADGKILDENKMYLYIRIGLGAENFTLRNCNGLILHKREKSVRRVCDVPKKSTNCSDFGKSNLDFGYSTEFGVV